MEKLPGSRGESKEAKKNGSILGYLTRKPGRPSALTKTASSSESSATETATVAASLTAADGSTATETATRNDNPFGSMAGIRKKRRRKISIGKNILGVLKAHVDARNNQGIVADTIIIIQPCTMVNDYVKRLTDHKEATCKNITVTQWIDQYKKIRGK